MLPMLYINVRDIQEQSFTGLIPTVLRCFSEYVFLKFCNIQKKTIELESLFNMVACLKTCNFIKKRLQRSYFPMNIAKYSGFYRCYINKLFRKILQTLLERVVIEVLFYQVAGL